VTKRYGLNGAHPARCIADVTLGLSKQFRLPCVGRTPSPFSDPRLDFLKEPRSVDELMQQWRLTAEQVLRTLVQYELGGSVKRLFDGRFVCALLL